MGIAESYHDKKRAQYTYSVGDVAFIAIGERTGEEVIVIGIHPAFSKVAGEPVYVISYVDGTEGKPLASELSQTEPE